MKRIVARAVARFLFVLALSPLLVLAVIVTALLRVGEWVDLHANFDGDRAALARYKERWRHS